MIYEESLRMPFVIRYPKEIKGGKRLDDLILNIDFAALFADYAGVKPPPFIQGRSFRPNLTGKTPSDWRKSMYYRYWAHTPIRPGHFGIRNERYKLIFFYGQHLNMAGAKTKTNTEPAWEFHDLEKDPHENHNAYLDPEYRKTIQEMKQELLTLKASVGDTDEAFPEMKDIMINYWDH